MLQAADTSVVFSKCMWENGVDKVEVVDGYKGGYRVSRQYSRCVSVDIKLQDTHNLEFRLHSQVLSKKYLGDPSSTYKLQTPFLVTRNYQLNITYVAIKPISNYKWLTMKY